MLYYSQGQFRQVSKILFIGLVLTIAPIAFMSSNMLYVNGNSNSYLAYGQSEEVGNNTGQTSSLPQPNDNDTLINVEASNALFEPAAGLSNVFGPAGLFPFENFNCADALTCGVSAGENAQFIGTFEKGNINNLTVSYITKEGKEIIGHPITSFISQQEVVVPSSINIVYNSRNPNKFYLDLE